MPATTLRRWLVAGALLLSAGACRPIVDESLDYCLSEEARGRYLYEAPTACGCGQVACSADQVCFQGGCCDPAVDPRCACDGECTAWEVCIEGTCCDPEEEDSIDNCGCAGPCDGTRDACGLEEGSMAFTCICDPTKTLTSNDDCGCNGPCDGTQGLECVDGTCVCNPASSAAKENDEDCGCSGPCPEGSYCHDSQCFCEDAAKIICDADDDGILECAAEDICDCEASVHLSDSGNCGCQGPCSDGELCDGGLCLCDPLDHQADNLECGCGEACDTEMGEDCDGGACVCPSTRLTDYHRCGCLMDCDDAPDNDHGGYTCSGGECVCNSDNLNNPDNCNCDGPCGDNGYDEYLHCEGTGSGHYTCSMRTNDVALACNYGVCECPTGFHECRTSAAAQLSDNGVEWSDRICVPDGYDYCGNCRTYCYSGTCDPEDDDDNGYTDRWRCN